MSGALVTYFFQWSPKERATNLSWEGSVVEQVLGALLILSPEMQSGVSEGVFVGQGAPWHVNLGPATSRRPPPTPGFGPGAGSDARVAVGVFPLILFRSAVASGGQGLLGTGGREFVEEVRRANVPFHTMTGVYQLTRDLPSNDNELRFSYSSSIYKSPV